MLKGSFYLKRWSWLLLFFLFRNSPVEGTEPAKSSLTAIQLHGETISIDGLLEEPVWRSGSPASGFIEMEPTNGAAAAAAAFVRVAYDENYLYVAADLHDPEPDLVYGYERQRDTQYERSDSFAVMIDAYHDHQNGFFFETNPLSAMSDALINRQRGQVNWDWDGLWDAASRKTSTGWSVEMRIPLTTLRFQPGAAQVWGIQFRRRTPHLKEVSFWSPLTREQDPFDLSLAGHLTGIGTTRQEHRLSIKPYGRGAYRLDRSDSYDRSDSDHDAGIDLRYHFRSNLTLDLTFNTDFAETEVDRLQVNMTRFPFFFPEKREFFLEEGGIYDFGILGRVQPFFSRKIGLANGRPVPIVGGGKLTGKAGPYGVGLLMMQTKESQDVDSPAEKFGLVRLTRDVGVQSRIGLIGTDREQSGVPGSHTVGLDTTIAPNQNLNADGFWVRSGGEQDREPGQAHFGEINYQDPFWRIKLNHLHVDKRFDPALGFVQQDDLDESYGYIDVRPQPASGPVREFGFKGEMTYQTDAGGDFLYQSNYWRAQADFRTGDFVLVSWDPQRERLPEDFEIRPGMAIPQGLYRYQHYNIYLNTDTRRPVSGIVSAAWGGFYDGRKRSLTVNLTAAPAEGVSLGGGWEIDRVMLPQGDFTAQTLEGDISLSFTKRTLFQGLVQWNREERIVAANLRFSWEYREGSRLYFIVNPANQRDQDTLLVLTKLTFLWEP
jgi:hypothetical protein